MTREQKRWTLRAVGLLAVFVLVAIAIATPADAAETLTREQRASRLTSAEDVEVTAAGRVILAGFTGRKRVAVQNCSAAEPLRVGSSLVGGLILAPGQVVWLETTGPVFAAAVTGLDARALVCLLAENY